jgi:hypothetical protein
MSSYYEVLKLAKVAERDLSVRLGFEEITRFLGHYLEQLTTEHNSTTELFVQVYERPMVSISSQEVHDSEFLKERVARCLHD